MANGEFCNKCGQFENSHVSLAEARKAGEEATRTFLSLIGGSSERFMGYSTSLIECPGYKSKNSTTKVVPVPLHENPL